jgi:FkbM family methyltransferase
MHKISYSQFGEDITAANLFRNVDSGFYVDVGAHHPLRLSNTAELHIRGWQGVNVEPRQEGIRLFQQYRPHAINVRMAIHNELDTVTLYKFRGGRINTILPGRAESLKATKEPVGEEVVPALSLNGLFEEHVPEGVHVHYLSVDIEGYDTEAILAFDLNRFKPDVICVEIHRFDILHLADHPIVQYLTDHGYELYAINIMSFTFVRTDAAKRLGVSQLSRA